MKPIARLRRWARGHTKAGHYSPVGQAFHWVLTALVFLQLWWGWRMGRLPVGADKLEGYQVHAQIGLLIMLLILLRMVWRLFIPGPINDADKPGWQSKAAHATHYAFYFLLLTLPLSGWVMWSAMAPEQPLSVFGLPWGQLPLGVLQNTVRWEIMYWAQTLHLWTVIALIGIIIVHAGAALKHHFIDRDDVLAAMMPFLQPLRRKRQEAAQHTPPEPDSPSPSNAG